MKKININYFTVNYETVENVNEKKSFLLRTKNDVG